MLNHEARIRGLAQILRPWFWGDVPQISKMGLKADTLGKFRADTNSCFRVGRWQVWSFATGVTRTCHCMKCCRRCGAFATICHCSLLVTAKPAFTRGSSQRHALKHIHTPSHSCHGSCCKPILAARRRTFGRLPVVAWCFVFLFLFLLATCCSFANFATFLRLPLFFGALGFVAFAASLQPPLIP